MEKIPAPPVRYVGSKWKIAQWVIAHFPPHETYVEPFAGGANVLFRKPISQIEVINDIDGEVVNFFKVLRERTADLTAAIEWTPYSKAEWALSFEPATDELERARRFYVRVRQSYGAAGSKHGWRFIRTKGVGGAHPPREWNRLHTLWAAARRLKQVMIEHDDGIDVIQRYDTEKTLFYVDPPYVLSERVAGPAYAYEMTDLEHRELAAALRSVKGMVVLSGYPSALYDELYADWTLVQKTARTNSKKDRRAVECLWLSPSCSVEKQMHLFGAA
jgi:DNA adenine methylase